MKILFPDLSRLVTYDQDRPAGLPLVREATIDGLRAFGHDAVIALDLDDGDADLALVDAVDAPSADALEAVLELRRRGLPVVVRLHGAWSAPQRDVDPEELDDGDRPVALRRILETADRVIVSTRSHLVRLASAHAIDSDRVKLLAPPAPEFDRAPSSPDESADGRRVALLIGEEDSIAYEAARVALDEAGLDVEIFEPRTVDGATVGEFRASVEAADLVAVAAAVPWSDRVLVDSCVALGRPVVAACGPVLDESPDAIPFARLPLDATEEEWADGIADALSRGAPARPSDEPDERLRRLTAILFEAAASASDCHDSRAA